MRAQRIEQNIRADARHVHGRNSRIALHAFYGEIAGGLQIDGRILNDQLQDAQRD
jgi:hypothetical protein